MLPFTSSAGYQTRQLDELLVLDSPDRANKTIWATHGPFNQSVPRSNANIISCPPLEPLPPDPLPTVHGGQPYQPRGISNRPHVSPLFDVIPDTPPQVIRGATSDIPRQRSPQTISPPALDFLPEDVPPRIARFRGWIPPQPKVVRVAATEEPLPPDALPQVMRGHSRTVPIPRSQTTTRPEDYSADVLPQVLRTVPQEKPWPRPVRVWQEDPLSFLSEASSASLLHVAGYRPVPYPHTIQPPLGILWDLFATIFADNVGVTPQVYGGCKEPIPNSEGPILVPWTGNAPYLPPPIPPPLPPGTVPPPPPPPLVPTAPIQRATFIVPITQKKNFPC